MSTAVGAVLISWLVLLVGVNVLAKTAGGDLLKSFSLPGTESQRAFDVLEGRFRARGDTGHSCSRSSGAGAVTSQTVRAEIEPVIAPALRHGNRTWCRCGSPYDPRGLALHLARRPDRAMPRSSLRRAGERRADRSRVRTCVGVVSKANTPDLQVELGGSMFTDQTQPASEAIGILAAVLILLLAFGSLLAMGLPIMTALFGIGIGLAIETLLARVLDVPSFAPQVTAMIGIGVGIDYALFISTRYREALHEGANPEQPRSCTRSTRAGRAVLFAGGTVVISLLGLFLIGVSFIRGLAIAASLAVLLVMAAAVTLLPGGARIRRLHHRQVRAAGREAPKPLGRRQLLDAVEPDVARPGRGRRRLPVS